MRLLAKDPAQRPTAEQAVDWFAGYRPTPYSEARESAPESAPARRRVGAHSRDGKPSRSPEPTPFAVPSVLPAATPSTRGHHGKQDAGRQGVRPRG